MKEIIHILVIGAGTMGHAIAQVYAQSGFTVDLVDKNQQALQRARDLINSNLQILKKFKKITQDDISDIIQRIKFSYNLESSASKADLAIEAVNERAEVKKTVFAQLNKFCSEDIILVSNTSGLNIFEIAEVRNPERLIIHHWFCPAYIIPLVEIVPGPETSPEIIELSVNLMKKLGKIPFVLKEYIDSFIVNRIQRVIMVQTYEMLQKGWATAEEIDLAIKTVLGVRLPIQGIIQSQDFTGLDLVLDKQKEFNTNERYPQIEELVKQGDLGVKSGKGFYDYGNRSEIEILQKRDMLCIEMLETLEKLKAFKPL
ncbi:MAG: 3-hydroxyacyl-CoA dehydrogenase family protein [Promethearchaeota archaeon]